MDIFGGALASIGGMAWSNLNMPAQGNVQMVPMGNVNMTPEGSVNMTSMGSVNMAAMGYVGMPPMPGFTPATGGGLTPGLYEVDHRFGTTVGQVVGGVTGTANEIIVGHNPFAMPSYNVQMPPQANNPFPGCGAPNPFFTAQLFGCCGSFYSGFGSALSRFG